MEWRSVFGSEYVTECWYRNFVFLDGIPSVSHFFDPTGIIEHYELLKSVKDRNRRRRGLHDEERIE